MIAPETNLLLESLSAESQNAILSHSKQVELSMRFSMQTQEREPRSAYFLTSGVASVVVNHQEGASTETVMIGREGVTGALSLFGTSTPTAECFMQIAGRGYKTPIPVLRDLFRTFEDIRTRILQCVQQQALTTIQIAGCNAVHEAEPRLARWLLMIQDRTREDSFQLTQDFLAQMLGARRTTVSVAAGTLQRAGFIEYRRGKVKILSREHLRTAACDCYDATERLFQNLYV